MTAPVYATDLLDLDTADTNVWVEPTGMTAGTIVSPETDFFIQGTGCAAKYMTSGGTGLGALVRDNGAGVTIPSPGGFFIWVYPQGVNQLHDFANGGIRLIVGSSTANYYAWRVAGDDTVPYGGWTCWVVDPSSPTTVVDDGTGLDADYQVGTPSGTKQVFGAGVNQQVNAKGGTGFDVMRYGRGELKSTFGALADGYATFAGAAAENDTNAHRWGLFQAISGGYLYKGLFLMGDGTNAVDFRDSNAVILIENTARVTSDFNTIEVRNASSRVDWTNVIVKALGTVARGNFLVTNDADINFDLCQFIDMGTFILDAATTITNSTFKSTDTITANGAVLTGSSVLTSRVAADESALLWLVADGDPDGNLDSMTFSKGTNAHHAISLTPNAATVAVTLRAITFTGFSASNGANDSVLELEDRGADTDWTINTPNCSGTVSYKKRRSTDTVTIVGTPVTLTITVVDLVSGDPVFEANVYIVAGATGPLTPGTQIIKGLTDINGEIADTAEYASDQSFTGWARKASVPYKTGPVSGFIDSATGAGVTIQMIEDS